MQQTQSMRRALLAAGLVLVMAAPVSAGTSFAESGTGRQFVLGTGSGVVSVVYSPVKFLYAAGSTVAGGVVLAFTEGDDTDSAVRIVRRGVRGDWWVHPDVFTGHRKLYFVGNPY